MTKMTIGDIEKKYIEIYREAGIFTDARFEVANVISETLNITRMNLLLRRNEECDEALLTDSLDRYLSGEPLAYITGRQFFYNDEFKVTSGVLIPRPDTELLVSLTLDYINKIPGRIRIADLCTGSGCIGLSIAHELEKNGREYEMQLIDISDAAISCASDNRDNLGLHNVKIIRSDALDPETLSGSLGGEFDAIVSNPPYITQNEMRELDRSVLDYEPHLALEAGEDGLMFYRALGLEAMKLLRKGGAIFAEHGYLQGDEVRMIFEESGLMDVETFRDYGNNDRVTVGYKRE